MSLKDKKIDWKKVEANRDFPGVAPGGYICGITAVNDVGDKEYFLIEYDIAQGDFKGYYRRLYEARGFWGASFVKSYKEKALPFFKAFLDVIAASNSGFDADAYDNDPNGLKGKYIGLVLAEEEYRARDGAVKTRLYVDKILPVSEIEKGNFTVPALKPLAIENTAHFPAASDTGEEKLPWEK